jgi:hypothetical protein
VSGPQMKILSYTNVCPNISGLTYWASAFIPMNETSVGLHCMDIPDFVHVYSSIYILTWNDQTQTVKTAPGFASTKQGWLFTLPSPSASSPPISSPTRFWFDDNSINAVNVRISNVNILDWKITDLILTPGLIFGASFMSPASNYAIVNQGYPPNLYTRKVDLWSGKVLANIPNYGNFAYAFSGADPSRAILLTLEENKHLYANVSVCDFDNLVQSPPLVLQFTDWAIYGGDFGWNTAAFVSDLAYFIMQIDNGPRILYQIRLPSSLNSAPILVDTLSYSFEYTHNLLATDDWLFTDTDQSVISRVSVSAN